MALTVIVTNAGRAALVNAANTGTAPVTIAQVGLSATALVPSPTATTLPGEFKRLATISGDVVADDMIHLIVRDEGLDVFTVRSLALYLADGTLFAIYGQADVLVEKSSQSMLLLAIDVKFEDVDATDLTFGDANFLNPPATTEQQGVVELATTAEAQAGIDALRALTPAAAKAAILGWLLAQDGAGSGLDADMLDGLHSASFLRADADSAFSGQSIGLRLPNIGSASTPAVKTSQTYLTAGTDTAGLSKMNNAAIQTWWGFSVSPTIAGYTVPQGLPAFSVDARAGWVYAYSGFKVGSDVVWHSGNDGSGSGLDADVLRGKMLGTSGNAIPLLDGGNTWSGTNAFSAMMKAEQMSFPSTGTIEALIYKDATGSLAISTNRQSPGNERYYSFGADGVFRIGGWGAWHAGNDGAGSGLDADLLDGQDGSYYTNIIARLGYTPANKAGDTFSGPIGRDSQFYMDISGGRPMLLFGNDGGGADRIEFDRGSNTFIFNLGGVEVGRFSANGLNVPVGDILIGRTNMAWGYLIRPNVAGYRNLQFAVEGGGSLDSLELNSLSVTIRGNAAWHSGNDGAGSGLDADLLDGFDSAAFAKLTGATFSGNVAISNSSADPVYQLNTVTGRFTYTRHSRSGLARWDIGANASAETGSNAGTDFYLNRFADNGAYIDTPFFIERATGDVTFGAKVKLTGGAGTNGLSGGNGDGASYSTYNLLMNVHWGLGIKTYDGTVNGFYDARAGRWDVKAGYRVNGVDVWHPGNDGSGSGLDADLLDGADASWFANIPARLGYTPLQQGGGAGQGTNKVYIGWSGSRLKAQVDAADQGNIVFDSNIADVWRSSNDGSGSGLDADLLDGFQAADFLRDVGVDFSEQGYLKLSNGLILQWGTAAGTYSANVNVQVNFPITFPNQILHVGGGNGDVQAQGNAVVGINYTTPPNTTRFYFRTNVAGQNRCNWIAIGR